jgi:hypothetical protein
MAKDKAKEKAMLQAIEIILIMTSGTSRKHYAQKEVVYNAH